LFLIKKIYFNQDKFWELAKTMKLSQVIKAGVFTVALIGLIALSGCGFINKIRAKNEVNNGARAYGSGKYVEAQHYFERALELDPNQPNAELFRARAIYAQYRPGNESPENLKIAQEAIDAYKKILEKDPSNDEAFNLIGALYGRLKQDEKQRDWIMQRTKMENIPADKRADAFTILANKDLSCSRTITDQKENITANATTGVLSYRKPKDPKDFTNAQQCTTEGLQYANMAISLNPNSAAAWGAKTDLLREMAKLAEMDGKQDQKADYTKQANEAEAKALELKKALEEKKKQEEAAKAAQAKKS
jgi:tetratricopeptide (TPR) repeat protein